MLHPALWPFRSMDQCSSSRTPMLRESVMVYPMNLISPIVVGKHLMISFNIIVENFWELQAPMRKVLTVKLCRKYVKEMAIFFYLHMNSASE